MLFSKKKREAHRPHPDWPWALSEGGSVTRDVTWERIAHSLSDLYPDNDSFLILEQKDPGNNKNYWFIQSAIALQGPDQGKYIVGCGWSGEKGPVLVERCYQSLDDVLDLFKTAFQRRPLDLSGFESFF